MPKKHADSGLLVGRTFGRMLIEGWFRGEKYYTLKCLCSCGNRRDVHEFHILSGKVVSCGCSKAEKAANRKKHGKSRTATYSVWQGMLNRCRNKNVKCYKNYGGRGIKVCDRWSGENGFENFLEDMKEKPEGKTLDRVNNEGPYSPENCRWASVLEQAGNTRANHNLTAGGITQCISAWLRDLGISYPALRYRIRTWGVEKALTAPVRPCKTRKLR